MTAETATTGGRGSSRSRLITLIVVVIVAVAVIALIVSRCGGSSAKETTPESTTTSAPTTTAPANTRTLPTMGFRLFASGSRVGYTTSGSTCTGTGSFAVATEGAPVIVRGAGGEELARTKLTAGVVSPQGCTFTTVAPVVVPKADEYKIEFPGIPVSGALPVAFIEEAAAKGDPLFGVKDG